MLMSDFIWYTTFELPFHRDLLRLKNTRMYVKLGSGMKEKDAGTPFLESIADEFTTRTGAFEELVTVKLFEAQLF